MITKQSMRILVATGVAALSLGAAGGSASAAHCTDNGGPGHSDFAAHVRANAGNNGHNEGEHKGWATCEENSVHGRP